MTKLKLILIILLALAMALFSFVKYSAQKNQTVPISYAGGESFTKRINCRLFKQTDSHWAEETIGGSNQKLRSVGCTICCVTMVLNHLGYTINPGLLNQKLKDKNGYTERGWLKWESISEAMGENFDIIISNQPTHHLIDESLKNNIPVITKIYIQNDIPHWVLITGKSEKTYLIHDPLGSSDGFEPLSKYKSQIHRIRIIKEN